MAKEVEKSTDPVYTLDLFTGVYASKDFMKTAKEYGPMLTEKRVRGAVVGITGIKVLLFQAYISFTNDTLVPAETKEEALEFLTEDIKD